MKKFFCLFLACMVCMSTVISTTVSGSPRLDTADGARAEVMASQVGLADETSVSQDAILSVYHIWQERKSNGLRMNSDEYIGHLITRGFHVVVVDEYYSEVSALRRVRRKIKLKWEISTM